MICRIVYINRSIFIKYLLIRPSLLNLHPLLPLKFETFSWASSEVAREEFNSSSYLEMKLA